MRRSGTFIESLRTQCPLRPVPRRVRELAESTVPSRFRTSAICSRRRDFASRPCRISATGFGFQVANAIR